MAELSGGHWLDTGDGLVSLDPLSEEPSAAETAGRKLEGRAAESPRDAAYRLYVEHRRECHQCARSMFRCPDGNALWNDYTAFR